MLVSFLISRGNACSHLSQIYGQQVVRAVSPAVVQRVRALESLLPIQTIHQEAPLRTPYLADILDAMDDATLRRIWGIGQPLQEKELQDLASTNA